MSDSFFVPIERLQITGTNARRDHTIDKALMASIKAVGLLYPLTVQELNGADYDVVDGAQRVMAIKALADAGDWHHGEVECRLLNGATTEVEGLEISLHANLRTPMHPLDECEAIETLSKNGERGDDIALRFGKDVRWLDQRVKLAQLVPEVKQAFRDGKISLAAAEAFTLGSDKQQRLIVKQMTKESAEDDRWQVSAHRIRDLMTEKQVSAAYANFDIADYPPDKIQCSLFSDEMWLLDRSLYMEMQDVWVQGEIQRLKDLGYNKVECLQKDDWQTLNQHVEVKLRGLLKPDQAAKLSCFLKADNNGLVHVHTNMARRKDVEKAKVEKKKHSADQTEAEPKPMLCTELSPAQKEILGGLVATQLYLEVTGGGAKEELMQWLVICQQFMKDGQWTEGGRATIFNGTRKRWERMRQMYPKETLLGEDEGFDLGVEKRLSLKQFCKLPKKERENLYRHAVGSMIYSPTPQANLKDLAAELDLPIAPSGDFFKRFRTDQLIDYRVRSGDKEAGKVAKKKEDHVADCVAAADTPKAFRGWFK